MKKFNLEEYLQNPSRKVVTRNGRNVRIICTDVKNKYPIVALLRKEDGEDESVITYTKNGEFVSGISYKHDLFFSPEKHERWINLYEDNDSIYASMDTFKTKEEAEALSYSGCIATVKIEWEE